MRSKPHRLEADSHHQLQGRAIDRTQPLQFQIDGRTVSGFAGDTVLSALLAAGIDTVGERGGVPLALSARHAPTIAPAGQAHDHRRHLPLERTLAAPGAEFVTAPHRRNGHPFARLTRRGSRSLGVDLDRPDALARPWLGSAGEAGPEVDLIVVGGGVAGMSAALTGAKRGLRVALIEAAARLGGTASLFGTLDGEETPQHNIARLSEAISKSDAISVLTSAEVFALRSGVVRLHQVQLRDGASTTRVVDLRAPNIVLATGALERLPVFPGNRLPGVSGALEAYEMAERYGVWTGGTALIATSSSPAYRLAMLAADAGITVPRIMDSRPSPQSRFIEFSKAYGITLAVGTIAQTVVPTKKGGLQVTPQLAMEALSRTEPTLTVDRLVVSGGWQPELTLWHMAGGTSEWNAIHARLDPQTGPQGIALAGSAAGWISRRACLASGSDAVDALLGRSRQLVEELLIDPIYETPDDAAPIGAVPDDTGHPAFLDAGWRYIERPRQRAARIPGWLPFRRSQSGWSLAETPHPLDIAEIAAGVQLGAIPAASAGIVAQERVAMVVIEAERDPADDPRAPLPLPPAYLHGRYRGATLWLAAPEESRTVETGALIYANADETDPLKAIGVVARPINGQAVVLIKGSEGQSASVRESGRAIAIRLVSPYRDGMV